LLTRPRGGPATPRSSSRLQAPAWHRPGTGDRGAYPGFQEGEFWEDGCQVRVHEARLPVRTQVTLRSRVPRGVDICTSAPPRRRGTGSPPCRPCPAGQPVRTRRRIRYTIVCGRPRASLVPTGLIARGEAQGPGRLPLSGDAPARSGGPAPAPRCAAFRPSARAVLAPTLPPHHSPSVCPDEPTGQTRPWPRWFMKPVAAEKRCLL